MAPRARMSLRLILLDIGVNDARDVVLVFLDLLEQRVVLFLVLVFDVVLEIVLGLNVVFGRDRFAVLVLRVLALGGRLVDDFGSLGLLGLFAPGLGGLFLRLLVLELLGFLVLGDDDGRGFGHGLRHARAPLLQERLGFKGKGAFRTFDRPLLQIVETGRATGTNSLGSEVGLSQDGASGKEGTKGAWVCHDRTGLSKRASPV